MFGFTIICLLSSGLCQVTAYKPPHEYPTVEACTEDMGKYVTGEGLIPPDDQDVFFNSGCTEYSAKPEEDMQAFSDYIGKRYGPNAHKQDQGV